MGVGKKLKVLISNKGLTQRQFAEAIEEKCYTGKQSVKRRSQSVL